MTRVATDESIDNLDPHGSPDLPLQIKEKWEEIESVRKQLQDCLNERNEKIFPILRAQQKKYQLCAQNISILQKNYNTQLRQAAYLQAEKARIIAEELADQADIAAEKANASAWQAQQSFDYAQKTFGFLQLNYKLNSFLQNNNKLKDDQYYFFEDELKYPELVYPHQIEIATQSGSEYYDDYETPTLERLQYDKNTAQTLNKINDLERQVADYQHKLYLQRLRRGFHKKYFPQSYNFHLLDDIDQEIIQKQKGKQQKEPQKQRKVVVLGNQPIFENVQLDKGEKEQFQKDYELAKEIEKENTLSQKILENQLKNLQRISEEQKKEVERDRKRMFSDIEQLSKYVACIITHVNEQYICKGLSSLNKKLKSCQNRNQQFKECNNYQFICQIIKSLDVLQYKKRYTHCVDYSNGFQSSIFPSTIYNQTGLPKLTYHVWIQPLKDGFKCECGIASYQGKYTSKEVCEESECRKLGDLWIKNAN